MSSLLISSVRPAADAAGGPVDLLVEDGVFSAIAPSGTLDARDAEHVDGRGLLALPGLVNAHAHVDKSWWGAPWEPYGGEATTQGRIAHERAERGRLGIPSAEATTRVLREFLRHGTTATRTHVDVDLGVGLEGIAAVREAVDRLEGAIDVEIVAFPQDGVLRWPGVIDLLDAAAAEGASSIGGLDPATIDRDPVGQLDALFAVAERRGVGLDIHLHDGGELGAFQYELVIERTIRSGMQGRVVISHGFGLGELSPARREAIVEGLAEAGVAWATVAPAGSAPLPWREMRAAGVGIGIGTDGIRDLWSPYGDGDLLKVALAFARLHGLRRDEELRHAIGLATSAAAPFVHRERHGLEVGAPADVVLVDAENAQDALVRTPRRETVVSRGRVVLDGGELLV